MTEPGSDFYVKPTPAKLGDPALDPPMTVRVHPDDDPRSSAARRVIKDDDGWWQRVTGWIGGSARYSGAVTDWPVQHPIVYGTVFRHAAAADARERGVASDLVGDMGVDAFRGGDAG